jgi:hypothetical protein
MHTSQSRLVREGRDARARRGPLRAHPAAAAAARVPGPCQGAPALQTMCDNVYMSVNVSVRLDDALAERLRMRARAAGESLSDRLRRYAEESARRDEHPLITFRDGPTGRRAGLVGGPDVWEVSMWVEDLADEPVVAPPTRGRLPARGLRKVLEVMRIYPPAGVPERECPRVGDATTKHRAVGWPARGDARRLAAANDPAHRRAATAPRVAACTPSACRPARAGSAPTRGVSLRASGLALSPVDASVSLPSRTRPDRTRSRRPRGERSAPRRSCICGHAGGTLSPPRYMSRPDLTAPCRTTMGWFALATSRVLDEATLGRSAHARTVDGVRVLEEGRSPHHDLAAPCRPSIVPANPAIWDGRGWFRTSVLSRVKRALSH